MRVSILGGSRFGVATVKQLIADKHEVVLIDKDRARLDALVDELDCGMIHGDGTLPSTLRDAFGDGADAFVALTNEDDVNLLASVVAKSVGYPRVIPQIIRPELLSIVDELGLGETITPHESVAGAIVSALEQHSKMDAALTLRNQLRIVSVHVPDSEQTRCFGDLKLPKGTRPVARVREGVETLVDDKTEIAAGDSLLLVVMHDVQDDVLALFSAPK